VSTTAALQRCADEQAWAIVAAQAAFDAARVAAGCFECRQAAVARAEALLIVAHQALDLTEGAMRS